MSVKRIWIGIAVGTLLAAGGSGTLIYFKQEDIEVARQEVGGLRTKIDSARKTIEGTAELEREVIVLREIAEVIDQILPRSEDLNNLIGNFHQYAVDTDVVPTSFKLKPDRAARGAKADFDKVGYTLTLEGGVFQFLDFLNRIETHGRFLAVPSFKVTSTSRQQIERTGQALHKIQVDVETYTYSNKGTVKAVNIEGYSRKRDLLAGEINRRRKALTLQTFHYRGERGRRDPWIDPRVPSVSEEGGPTVQEQMAKVDELAVMIVQAAAQWQEIQRARNIIDRMVKKDELDKSLALVDEELRRIEDTAYVSYVPAQRRLETEVYEPRDVLRALMEKDKVQGPRRAEMEELIASMERHIELGEYALAIRAFQVMEPSLADVQGDPVREALAADIRALVVEATTLRDFEGIELVFGGSVIIEAKPPVIIINGRSYGIGDVVAPDLEIADIRPNEVDFYFRGFVLTRVY